MAYNGVRREKAATVKLLFLFDDTVGNPGLWWWDCTDAGVADVEDTVLVQLILDQFRIS